MFTLAHAKRDATAIAVFTAALTIAWPIAAKPLHHHHRVHASRHVPAYAYVPRGYGGGYAYGAYGPTSANPYPPSAADDPYNPYAPPGAAIRALARQNQNAPGVTNELAPDNIATATGGPSGGVPGFSGH